MLNFVAPGIVEIIGVVTVSSSTVNVIWIPPTQPNGIIIHYDVIHSVYGDTENSKTARVASTETSYVISDLGEYLEYLYSARFYINWLFNLLNFLHYCTCWTGSARTGLIIHDQ